MPLTKCPKCELNYLLNGEGLCTVCSGKVRPITYTDDEEAEICTNCGEHPTVRGEEYCVRCLAEFAKSPAVTKPIAITEEEGDVESQGMLKTIDDVDIDAPTFELPEIQPDIDVDVDDEDLPDDEEQDDEEGVLYLDDIEEDDEDDDSERDL